jgi:hypothetical protein
MVAIEMAVEEDVKDVKDVSVKDGKRQHHHQQATV